MRNGISAAVGALMVMALLLVWSLPVAVQAQETYRIGGIFSVTGPSSFLGDPEKKSMEMVIEEINAQGGIDGKKLEAVIYDDEGDPTKAVLAANKLISRDKVIAVVGPSLTQTTLAILPILEKANILLVSCAAGIKITEPVKPFVFKTAQNDVLAVATIYGHMKANNIKNVGLLTVENSFGESGREQLSGKAAEFGINIVRAETFGARDTDMTAQLTKIRAGQPDAIICWGTNPGPAVVARNAKQLNIDVPLYQSHGVASPKFIELAGEAADDILLPTGKILIAEQLPDTDPQKPVLSKYISEFEKRFQMPVSGFGGYAYDAVQMLAKAMKGSGGDKSKLRDQFEKIQGHVGVTGTFNFSPGDHNGLGEDAFVMVKIQGGKWRLLSQ